MRSRGARVARGSAAAFVATFVAAFCHGVAADMLPSFSGLGVALGVAMPAAVFLTGKTLSRWRLAAVVLLSQALFHTTMTWGQSAGQSLPVGSPHGLDHSGQTVLQMAAMADSHGSHDGNMWLAHVIAAVVTFVLLRRAELVLWSLLELSGYRVAVLLTSRACLPLEPARSVAPAWADSSRRRLADLGEMRHRGPPRLA